MEIFSNLPFEIKNLILEFEGKIKYHHGKYSNQLIHDKMRYSMFNKIFMSKYISNSTEIPSFVSFKVTYLKYLTLSIYNKNDYIKYSLITLLNLNDSFDILNSTRILDEMITLV